MGQTHDEITQNLAERWCGQVTRRDDRRGARRLDRKPRVDGVSRLDGGALLADFFHFLQAIEVMALRAPVHGTAIHRELLPFVQSLLLSGLKTVLGSDSMNARPVLLFSDEALMPLVGFHAQQVRQGGGQRGRTKRQGERTPGPLGPDTLANNRGPCHVRDLEAWFTGGIRALAKAGVFGKRGTGMADGPDLETTERDQGCGQATRTRRIDEQWGWVQESEVTVYGWQGLLWLAAVTTSPRAVKVVQIQDHEALWTRALGTHARARLAGYARRHQVVFAKGLWAGTDLGWLAQPGLLLVVPAQDHMAVPAEAQALAAAGEGGTVGHRVHTARHGPGQGAWTERLETAVVGITGPTTSEPYGTEEHGRDHNRHDVEPTPIPAVVVRTGKGKDDGPGGHTVFLTKAAGHQPLKPCDDDADRRLLESCGIKAATQPWDWQHPPQKTARAGRGPVLFTWLLVALATASRRPGEREALGGEPGGWQCGRGPLLEQTRAQGIVFAQGADGICHRAAFALLMGVTLKDVPPELGTRREILATDGLPPVS
jgi:hypothetical protein